MPKVPLVVLATFASVALFHFVETATAQTLVTQIKLTEKQVQDFIVARKNMTQAAIEMQGSTLDQPDTKLHAASEAVAKKSNFRDLAEYDNVAANILMVVAGIDPLTKRYTDPQTVIKKGIAKVTADKTISEKEKKELLNEFEKLLKVAEPIQFARNIELVRKYYDKIDTALQSNLGSP